MYCVWKMEMLCVVKRLWRLTECWTHFLLQFINLYEKKNSLPHFRLENDIDFRGVLKSSILNVMTSQYEQHARFVVIGIVRDVYEKVSSVRENI